MWSRRLVRHGWAIRQGSNAYVLALTANPPEIHRARSGGQAVRETRNDKDSTVQAVPAAASPSHRAALERLARDRQAAFNAAWLDRKATPAG